MRVTLSLSCGKRDARAVTRERWRTEELRPGRQGNFKARRRSDRYRRLRAPQPEHRSRDANCACAECHDWQGPTTPTRVRQSWRPRVDPFRVGPLQFGDEIRGRLPALGGFFRKADLNEVLERRWNAGVDLGESIRLGGENGCGNRGVAVA